MAVSQLTIDKILGQKETYENIKVFVKGNSKLEGVLIFNLPPNKTCLNGSSTVWCREHCYAMKGQHTFSNVIKANETRYQMSLKDDFVEKACNELRKSKCNKVRFHASGEFYSLEYIKKVTEIVKAFPDIKFLAFTKQRKFMKELKELSELENMSLFESLDPSRTKPKMGLKIAIVSNEPIEKYFNCPGDNCKECGYTCWNTKGNVRFHEH